MDQAFSDKPNSAFIHGLIGHIIEEDPTSGPRLVDGLLAFTQFTRTHTESYGKIQDVREYLQFRDDDIASQ